MRNTARGDVDKLRKFLKTGSPGPHVYVVLLGLNRFDFPGVIEQIEKGLPYPAFERFQKNTGFTTDELRELLQIPRRTLARRKSEGRFSPDESDRLVRAARVFGTALHLFGGDAAETAEWLTEAQRAFGGITPLELSRTDIGAQEVERLVFQLEHGVLP